MKRVLIWYGLLLMLAGCGGSGVSVPGEGPRAAAVLSVTSRLDVVPGSPLVITLPREAAPLPDSLEGRLDDGSKLKAAAYRVRVGLEPDGAGAEAAAWLPPAGVWKATRVTRERPGVGVQVIVVETPQTSTAQMLDVAGRRYRLQWLPGVEALPSADENPREPLMDPWRPVAEQALLADPSLLGRVKGEAASPITRWRFHLLMDGLSKDRSDPGTNPFDDTVVEAIARQNEDRWRVALAWTWSANPELAWRLKQRLASVVDFGAGVYAPAWSVDHAALDRLLSDMLDPGLTPTRRCELVEAWLIGQPAGVAWTIDDAGLMDDARKTLIPAIGFANLTDHTTRVWIDTPEQAEADFRPLLSLSTVKLLVPAPAPGNLGVLTTPLTAHVGGWSGTLQVQSTRAPVAPPGFVVGPLLEDYTMEAWSGVASSSPSQSALGSGAGSVLPVPPPEWTTGALLLRSAAEPSTAPSSAESRRWELLVECRMPARQMAVSGLSRELVRIFVGPAQKPRAVLRVDMTGEVLSELPPSPLAPPELSTPAGHVEVTRAADRWAFRLPLPPGSLEKDGTLRLGITRVDALGRRTAWPRPMLPWQDAVGRAALDTSAWRGETAR